MSAAVRRILIGLLAALVCHATTASASETGAAAVVHAIPGLVPGEGFGVERGYAPSPLGQVHYQDVRPTQADPRQPVYVLLHQVPWFHVYYNRAQAELARRGIRSIAFDTPGYGLSARPRSPPDIAAYARAIEAAIDHLKLKRIVLVGHHTGATIGVEIARTQPRRLAWLVLHGVALYTPAEAAARLAAPHWDQNYKAEGAHLGDRWLYLTGRVAGSPDSIQWSVLSLYLAGDTEWYGHHAVFRYDMGGALAALRVPVTVLSNDDDLLDFTFERVRALRPDFVFNHLSAHSSNMAFDEPVPWVAAVVGDAAP
jgi:pimeloyl-ACP methyl ester carboxylesterase